MNNIEKKLFKNFCQEFEGCNPDELAKNNLFQYIMILNWITAPKTLKELNTDLIYIIDELYLLKIDEPIKFLFY